MFRLGGMRPDPAEEKKKAMEEERLSRIVVYSNIGTFVASILAIKATPYILERFF